MSTVAFDHEQHRRASLAQWEGAASGWERRQQQMRQFSAPVSEWLIDAVRPQPGPRILDLAAGVGETGCIAAAAVGPDGRVILADQAEAMIAAAGRRARELGLANGDCRQLNAEWLDLPLGGLDAVICRWGFMLMADPDAALTECRRVLRPGGRIALAVWGAPERNPWVTGPMGALIELGILPAPPAPPAAQAPGDGEHRPGMFALADANALAERLRDAGFSDVSTETLTLTRTHPDFEDFWETTLDMSAGVHDTVMERPAEEIERIRETVRARLAPFTDAGGALAIPALTVLACASA